MRPYHSPILLLLATGGLLGATFPLGKLSGEAGVPAPVWAFLVSAGSAVVILAALLAIGRRVPIGWRHLRYYAIAGIVSYGVPNLLLFSVIPHVGAGFASIMFTLSPIMTLIFAILLGMKRPTSFGVAGVGIGFIGALMIVLSKGEIGHPAEPYWIALALAIPVALAAGNIYRTMDWPPGAAGLPLAVGTNAAAAIFVATASLLVNGSFPLRTLADAPGLAAAQVVASAGMFAVFFQLQIVGGPVYLSQIGYVAAAVGLASGTWLLGETYGALTWLGAAIVAAGVIMTTVARKPDDAPKS